MSRCRICQTPAVLFFEDTRKFYKCPECSLVFTSELPDPTVEAQHYKSQWGNADPASWSQKADLLLGLIGNYRTPRRILDFGSGSGDLTRALRQRGLAVTPLDPLINGYLKDQKYVEKFDVVLGIEVVEHLPHLWEELDAIEQVLADDGIVIFSTLLTNEFIDQPEEVSKFQSWWYKDDPTHVSFFCNRALSKLADLGGYDIDVFSNMLFVISKSPQRKEQSSEALG